MSMSVKGIVTGVIASGILILALFVIFPAIGEAVNP